VIAQPLDDEDEFLILGSDGLWGVVEPQDAVKLARAELDAYDGDATMASDKLVEVALKRHVDDNVSAMVICLNLRAREVEAPRRPRLQLMRPTRAATAPLLTSPTLPSS
jgi:serine/threonine protein phosphatase PrpC